MHQISRDKLLVNLQQVQGKTIQVHTQKHPRNPNDSLPMSELFGAPSSKKRDISSSSFVQWYGNMCMDKKAVIGYELKESCWNSKKRSATVSSSQSFTRLQVSNKRTILSQTPSCNEITSPDVRGFFCRHTRNWWITFFFQMFFRCLE